MATEGAAAGPAPWRFADGSEYTGETAVVDGGVVVREGQGMFVDASAQTRYTGSWQRDCMHGEGRLELSDGSTYEGSFVKNKFEGQGVFTWTSGEVLVATWRDNKPVSQSTFKDTGSVDWITTSETDYTPTGLKLTPQIKLIHK
eukprot:m.9513 g.9513  ORF g.9513 m.9513 type:complete len:144 (+) comp2642_c0_seq1:41-472(+)